MRERRLAALDPAAQPGDLRRGRAGPDRARPGRQRPRVERVGPTASASRTPGPRSGSCCPRRPRSRPASWSIFSGLFASLLTLRDRPRPGAAITRGCPRSRAHGRRAQTGDIDHRAVRQLSAPAVAAQRPRAADTRIRAPSSGRARRGLARLRRRPAGGLARGRAGGVGRSLSALRRRCRARGGWPSRAVRALPVIRRNARPVRCALQHRHLELLGVIWRGAPFSPPTLPSAFTASASASASVRSSVCSLLEHVGIASAWPPMATKPCSSLDRAVVGDPVELVGGRRAGRPARCRSPPRTASSAR